MTCIVGIEEDGRVYIGGDRAGVENGLLTRVAAPKVFQLGEYLIGYTTSFRMGQVLQYGFTPPPLEDSTDIVQFLVRKFIPALRFALEQGGWLKTKDGREESGMFLLGVRGKLFGVEDDFNVLSSTHRFLAVGSGMSVALGALWQTRPENCRNVSPQLRLKMALEAAEEFTTSVCAPFDILECGQ